MSDTIRDAWRVNPEYPNFEISEFGDIRRLTDSPSRKKGSRLRGSIDYDGYIRYQLTNKDSDRKQVFASRLVLETFVGKPPDERYECAHNNGSRIFNHYSNLRWVLSKENHSDREYHETAPKGEQNGRAVLDEDAVIAIRNERKENLLTGRRVVHWANLYGLSLSAIYNAARGKTWSHIRD